MSLSKRSVDPAHRGRRYWAKEDVLKLARPEKPLVERQVVHTRDLESETVLSSKMAFSDIECIYGYDKRGLEKRECQIVKKRLT